MYRNNIDVFRHWGYRLPAGKLVGLGDRNALQIKIATFLPHSSYSRTSARPLRARMPFTTQTYKGIGAWLYKRNHQMVIDSHVLPFDYFMRYFMKLETPYAFHLAEELENDQTLLEKIRRKILIKIYEFLVGRFAYEPARQKLQMLK